MFSFRGRPQNGGGGNKFSRLEGILKALCTRLSIYACMQ